MIIFNNTIILILETIGILIRVRMGIRIEVLRSHKEWSLLKIFFNREDLIIRILMVQSNISLTNRKKILF